MRFHLLVPVFVLTVPVFASAVLAGGGTMTHWRPL